MHRTFVQCHRYTAVRREAYGVPDGQAKCLRHRLCAHAQRTSLRQRPTRWRRRVLHKLRVHQFPTTVLDRFVSARWFLQGVMMRLFLFHCLRPRCLHFVWQTCLWVCPSNHQTHHNRPNFCHQIEPLGCFETQTTDGRFYLGMHN